MQTDSISYIWENIPKLHEWQNANYNLIEQAQSIKPIDNIDIYTIIVITLLIYNLFILLTIYNFDEKTIYRKDKAFKKR
jgi:hypothetical protein